MVVYMFTHIMAVQTRGGDGGNIRVSVCEMIL